MEFGWKEQTFHYNRTFTKPPLGDESEPAWDDLIPREYHSAFLKTVLTISIEGRGFVRYPANNPDVHVISAVHQLHCLVSFDLDFSWPDYADKPSTQSAGLTTLQQAAKQKLRMVPIHPTSGTASTTSVKA